MSEVGWAAAAPGRTPGGRGEGRPVGAGTGNAVEGTAGTAGAADGEGADASLPSALVTLPPDAPERVEGLLSRISEAASVNAALRAVRIYFGLRQASYVGARHGDAPHRDPYVRTTFPPAWIARYLFMEYWKIDPVLHRGFRHATPFAWSELEHDRPEVAAFFADAAAHGIGKDGLVMPLVNRHGQRGMLSVSTDLEAEAFAALRRRLLKPLMRVGQLVHARAVHEIHGDAPPPPRLSPREREVLGWIGEGKEVPDIAIITGLSEHTVRTYLKSARLKLDCGTKAQAAVKAERLALLATDRR